MRTGKRTTTEQKCAFCWALVHTQHPRLSRIHLRLATLKLLDVQVCKSSRERTLQRSEESANYPRHNLPQPRVAPSTLCWSRTKLHPQKLCWRQRKRSAAYEADITFLCAADYDLTGQIVWPGAQLMGAYLSTQAERFAGKKVLELGSGVGKRPGRCGTRSNMSRGASKLRIANKRLF